jgi:hypothetical protein
LNPKQPISTFSSLHDDDSRINSSNTTELFKIEISGIEIVVRQKSVPDLNKQHHSTLKNRVQGRMHPYHVPAERHNKINSRDHVIINSTPQQYNHSCSQP